VNLVREEFETRGFKSHKRVEQAKKSGEEYIDIIIIVSTSVYIL